jgi:DNA-binding SARP family transcriptional activator
MYLRARCSNGRVCFSGRRTESMARWKITFLGELSIRSVSGRQIRLPPNAWALLTCLISTPAHCAGRGTLASRLWPETNDLAARRCLASTLWRMKEATRAGPCLIDVDDDQISLRLPPNIWIDVIAFDRRMQSFLLGQRSLADPAKRIRMRRVLDLYRGEFAAGIDAPWALIERERLRMLYLDGLFALASSHFNANDWAPAAAVARKLCLAEPLREDAHRLLMAALARTGNRALALKQFEHCRATLAQELNVQPMRETVELYVQLSEAASANGDSALPSGTAAFRNAILTARHSVHEALGILEAALEATTAQDQDDLVTPQ